jgi:hypothetical protein
VCPSRTRCEAAQRSSRGQGTPSSSGRSTGSRERECPGTALQKELYHSAGAAIVNSQSLENIFRIVIVVQQIMSEFNGAISEQDKIVAITKIFLNLMKQNGQ